MGEWCSERNPGLDPSTITGGSGARVWWRCTTCGYEWIAQVAARARSRGRRGCPACARRNYVRRGTIAQERPELVASWDALRNSSEDSPDSVTCGSNRLFSWVCPAGHGWRARVADRASGNGCPVCAGAYIDPLPDTHPELAAEWDHDTNDNGPEAVTAGSAMEAAWRCSNGHRWVKAVCERARGVGCPVCADREREPLSAHPHLVAEWDVEANGPLPDDLTAGSEREFLWRCPEGHTWRAPVKRRSAGHGCPDCARASHPATMRTVARHGEAHPKARLTWSDVASIRADTRSNSELARLYGVSKPTIDNVRLHKTWLTDGDSEATCASGALRER